MSRIGKLPIEIVEGVTVTYQDRMVTVKWPKWELQQTIPEGVNIVIEDKEVQVSIISNEYKNYWWLMRSLIFNMVEWVTKGYEKKLLVLGVGYAAQAQGQKLVLKLGLSHPVEHMVPSGVTISTEKDAKGNDIVILQGIDKQLVGEQAAKIKAYRKPEPYKGKGIRYLGEHISLKAGKTASK